MSIDPKELSSEVTAVLVAHRKAAGLSHEKLADLAKVSRSTISRIESEQTNGTLFVFQKVASALSLPLSEVIKEAEDRLQK